ncbi:MAG: hypothetical protein GXX99_03515 [Clostridiales bacterium]|nr:hypothetical protein [Clostridiales bacterium]
MTQINSVFLLMAAVIAAGFLLKRAGLVGDQDYRILFKLIVGIVIPCLILSNFKNVTLTPAYLSLFVVACLYGLALSGLSYLLLRGKTREQKGMAVLNFAGINVGFIGIPLAEALFGQQAMPAIVAIHGGNAVTLYAFCILHAQLYTDGGADFGSALRRLVKSPPLIALAAALLMAATGLRLPAFCYTFTDTVSKINTPLSMLAVGMTVDFFIEAGERRLIGQMISLRYLVAAVAAALLWRFAPYRPAELYPLMLFVLLPGSINCIAYCSEYGFHPKAAALFNNLTNLVSFAALWLVFGLLLPPL